MRKRTIDELENMADEQTHVILPDGSVVKKDDLSFEGMSMKGTLKYLAWICVFTAGFTLVASTSLLMAIGVALMFVGASAVEDLRKA